MFRGRPRSSLAWSSRTNVAGRPRSASARTKRVIAGHVAFATVFARGESPIHSFQYLVGAAQTSEQIVQKYCAACHATGAAGAPKIGDRAAWAPLVKGGLERLAGNATKGVKAMPPRGGLEDTPEARTELLRAIIFMANQSGGSLKEPAPKPAAKKK